MKKRLLAVLLLIAICLSAVGCTGVFKPADGLDNGDGDGAVEFPSGEEILPNEWNDGVLIPNDATALWMTVGESEDISGYVEGAVDGVEWSSACPAVVSVSGGVITANKVGRTEIYAEVSGEVIEKFVVTAEFKISTDGFDFSTTLADSEVYYVESLLEANTIIDNAISRRVKTVKMDFSAISPTFNVKTDFVLNSEFGGHTSLKMMFYPSTPYSVEFEIIYNADAASYTTPAEDKNYYESVKSANSLIRAYVAASGGKMRDDDFDGFAINSREITLDVYNSEELWWAIEHGYNPTFPKSGTKAELFYERAKMILREIITEDMTEYEKVLSIYEYLITAVSYDYDAYFNTREGEEEKNNTCYYLEGVFEVGRAVCDGKSKAFVLLCGIEGIDCVRAFGTLRGGGVGHAWNYVELGGVWYMIDTTDGDERYESTSAVSKFLGAQLETVGYGSFLTPAYTHYEKYEYTDMWAHLIPTNKNYAYGEDYFSVDIGETGYDFVISSSKELKGLLSILRQNGMPEKFILNFKPQSALFVNSYFSGIESEFGVDLELYKTSESTYIAIFKLK